jgi:hypothetical protein
MPSIVDVCNEIERLWFCSAFLYDHLHTYPKVTSESCFKCFTALSGLASATDKLRLGQLVLYNSYRNPAPLAKIPATFDVISRGRTPPENAQLQHPNRQPNNNQARKQMTFHSPLSKKAYIRSWQ